MVAIAIQQSRRRRITPVVLVGGIAQRPSSWKTWVRDLAARGIPCVIARVPAAGFADRQSYLDAIDGARMSMLARCGLDAATPVSIVGFSAGGVAAVDYLRRHRDRVDRVVAVSSPLAGNELAAVVEDMLGPLVPRWVHDLTASESPLHRFDADLHGRVTSITGAYFDGVVTAKSGTFNEIDVVDSSELGSTGRFHSSMQTSVPAVRRAALAALGLA